MSVTSETRGPGRILRILRPGRIPRPGRRAVVLLAGVAVVAAGAGVLAGRAGGAAGAGPGCRSGDCLPQVRVPALRSAVEARGFVCSEDDGFGGSVDCELNTGFRSYTVSAGGLAAGATRVTASAVCHGPAVDDGARALLGWVASLPLADDPAAQQQVHAWLTGKLAAAPTLGATSSARIGEVSYELTAPELDERATCGYRLVVSRRTGGAR